jgi:hypothetical protein
MIKTTPTPTNNFGDLGSFEGLEGFSLSNAIVDWYKLINKHINPTKYTAKTIQVFIVCFVCSNLRKKNLQKNACVSVYQLKDLK